MIDTTNSYYSLNLAVKGLNPATHEPESSAVHQQGISRLPARPADSVITMGGFDVRQNKDQSLIVFSNHEWGSPTSKTAIRRRMAVVGSNRKRSDLASILSCYVGA